jgi:hypothetical protein
VPFASFFAKLKIEERHRGGFELKDFFTLGTNSNGIDPLTENVTLQIGPFSVTIPAGSFKHDPNGRFEFKGVISGVRLEVQIVSIGNNIWGRPEAISKTASAKLAAEFLHFSTFRYSKAAIGLGVSQAAYG